MDTSNNSGLAINASAVVIAQIISEFLEPAEMSLLASFLYTISDCLNTIVDAGNL